MASKTLFESVMWGTSKEVQDILAKRDLTIDENYTDYALLLTALRRKRKEIAKILMNKGCRVKKLSTNNAAADTPLHLAVRLGDVDIVRMLLERGANVDTANNNGETSLYFAMKNSKKGGYEIVDLILSASDVDCANTINKDGFSHFHIACVRNNVAVVENFVKKGVNVNDSVNFESREWPGYTALHFAVEYNCVDTLKLLLRCNANPTLKNADDKTALFLAMEKQSDEMSEIILSSISDRDFNAVDEHELSHFHIACMKHHLGAVNNFLQHGIDINQAVEPSSTFWPGFTALHFAVRGLSVHCRSQVEVVELLLRHKADVNAQDIQGQTPLHLACLQSDDKISKLIKEISHLLNPDKETVGTPFYEKMSEIIDKIDQVKIVNLLLEYKSDANARNMLDETPLFYLYQFDRTKISNKNKVDEEIIERVIRKFNKKRKDIVQTLLNYNADVNVQNDNGQSLLHLIADINKIHDDDEKEEVAKLILNKGANVNLQTKYGLTPLHLASKHGHVKLIELFLQHQANVNAYETADKSTPLHLATTYQQVRTMDLLLKNNADVTALKCNDMNVLHIMALMNPEASEEPEFVESYERIFTNFIERGCDINAQDINGRTPLHLASWDHNNAATWALLLHFADINIEDSAGETPFPMNMNNSGACMDTYCIFRDFINMLKLTGLHVSKKNEMSYMQLYQGAYLDTGDDFLVQCREEIDKMKNIKINNRTSLYDILFKNSTQMVVYAGNEVLEEILNSSNFESDYNIYKYLLKSQFRKGQARKILLKNAKESLESITGFRLPDSCSDKIFQDVSDNSLNDVVKAKTVVLTNQMIKIRPTVYSSNDCLALDQALAYCKNLTDNRMDVD